MQCVFGSSSLKLHFIWNSGDKLVNYECETVRRQRINREGLEKFSICFTVVSRFYQSILKDRNSNDDFSYFSCLFYEKVSLMFPA